MNATRAALALKQEHHVVQKKLADMQAYALMLRESKLFLQLRAIRMLPPHQGLKEKV